MLNRIRDCIHSLSILLDNIEYSSIEARLKNVESKLTSIEKELRHQSRFAAIAFVYGLALAGISIGLAILGENPSGALLLMITGLVVIFILAILGIVLGFTKKSDNYKQ